MFSSCIDFGAAGNWLWRDQRFQERFSCDLSHSGFAKSFPENQFCGNPRFFAKTKPVQPGLDSIKNFRSR
jgi:hypothetical protein